ncbi:MAG: serine/threonine-protein kinase, partial [Chitinivibrionales bacterium]|nr:serine/threonine-protein kinase [Chitinivibrionales bacterium]
MSINNKISTGGGLGSDKNLPLKTVIPAIRDVNAQVIATLWSASLSADQSPGMTIRPADRGSGALSPLFLKTRSMAGSDGSAATPSDFILLRQLDEGGMGLVFESLQTSCDRIVAVKMMKSGQAHNARRKSEFLAEAVTTADLAHPNIVPLYDLGVSENGELFYAMKLVEGRAWCDVITEKGLNENLDILMRVADAVAFAHSRGIIHRDLKPDNVMLGDYGEVLVVDWGLAVGVGEKSKAGRLNADSPVAGTPAYMPPEMAAGEYEKIGFASDIYLLGGILYKIVTGQPPHTGKSFLECVVNAAANRLQETGKIGELLNIALKAMATEPAERYADVKEFQGALRLYQVHSESLLLANQAEKEFDDARVKEDYTTFNGCVFLFRQALKLWDGNQFARQGLKIAQLTYAKYAVKKGDLDLARDLLAQADFLDSALGRKVDDLIRDRDHEREAGQREWQLVFQEDFSDPAAVADRWRIEGADLWEVKDGQLHTAGGAPMLAIIKRPFWGDIRVTFECRQEGDYLNDVSAVIGGYHFKYGGWTNLASGILATDDTVLAEKKHSPLERSHVYHAAFEKIGNRLKMVVDDKQIFDVIDEGLGQHEMTAWISRSPDEVALFGWKADTWYSQVKVYMLGAPRKEDLFDTAERLLQGNRYATARDLFEEVILGTKEPARLERAKQGIRKAEEAIKSWENLIQARKNSDKVKQV